MFTARPGKTVSSRITLSDQRHRFLLPESGLLGTISSSDAHQFGVGDEGRIYLNVSEPFALITVGVQGGGKSHTTAVILENCLLQAPVPAERPLIALTSPMAALVLHYDQSESNVCEATGLVHLAPRIFDAVKNYSPACAGSLHLNRVVVLVSPSFYKQRRAFYGDSDKYHVLPLLFRWAALDAVQLKKLMRINDSDNQLYVGMMLAKLREYQRAGGVPKFDAFFRECLDACFSGQSEPLEQRLELLKQFVAESQANAADLSKEQVDLEHLVGSGVLVVADLTDPMLSPAEANGVFQVLLEQFRHKALGCGKVVVCDEAHKYFDTKAKGGDGLANSIVDTVRLMRHEGIRVVVSTQSPMTMPPELLELATVAVLHSFHSHDWYRYLGSKLPLPEDGFSTIRNLGAGGALVFASCPRIGSSSRARARRVGTQQQPRSAARCVFSSSSSSSEEGEPVTDYRAMWGIEVPEEDKSADVAQEKAELGIQNALQQNPGGVSGNFGDVKGIEVPEEDKSADVAQEEVQQNPDGVSGNFANVCCFKLQIRPRFTQDRGMSKENLSVTRDIL